MSTEQRKWTSRTRTGKAETRISESTGKWQSRLICIIPHTAGTPAMRNRDAREICALPDLLAAAKAALHTLEITRETLAEGGNGGSGDDEICEEAKFCTPAIHSLRAAIAKATGEPASAPELS